MRIGELSEKPGHLGGPSKVTLEVSKLASDRAGVENRTTGNAISDATELPRVRRGRRRP